MTAISSFSSYRPFMQAMQEVSDTQSEEYISNSGWISSKDARNISYGAAVLAVSSTDDTSRKVISTGISLLATAGAFWNLPEYRAQIRQFTDALEKTSTFVRDFFNTEHKSMNSQDADAIGEKTTRVFDILSHRLSSTKFKYYSWIAMIASSVIFAVGSFVSTPMLFVGLGLMVGVGLALIYQRAKERTFEKSLNVKPEALAQQVLQILAHYEGMPSAPAY